MCLHMFSPTRQPGRCQGGGNQQQRPFWEEPWDGIIFQTHTKRVL